ncbi:MAG TPA: hypothetical protein VN873_13835 [Candidatus Angelobacter sp.]|nr:hypothetical protein [Candidatus Angelobacter sp.]
MFDTMRLAKILMPLPIVLLVFSAAAQTNRPVADDTALVQKKIAATELKERIRNHCIEGRRSICGKIVRILPGGLLVEAGYTNLLREPLTKSWLVPRSAVASLAPNRVESKEPGAICFGTVFLTDLPRGKPHLYDYVIICGYPTGEMSYAAVGIKKTARRFSANLDKAVNTTLAGMGAQLSSAKEN